MTLQPVASTPPTAVRHPAARRLDSFAAGVEAPRLLPRPAAPAPDPVARMQAALELGHGNRSFETSDSFAMMLNSPGADDALVAAGAALAKGLPSLYAVPDRKSLPWFLREADQSFSQRVRVAAHPDPKVLAREVAASHPGRQVKPVDLPARAPIDTFIGCLMSGLTEEQYAEGRSHLKALSETLPGENYCEGLMVASTNGFDTPKDSLVNDLAAVEASRECVFYVYDGTPRPSGMWVEAGYALAKGKPCTFLVPTKDALPPCLRSANVVEYGTHEDLLRSLAGRE